MDTDIKVDLIYSIKKFVKIIFMVVGTVFILIWMILAGISITLNNEANLRESDKVVAIVEDIKDSSSTVVYNYNNEEYTTKLNWHTSEMQVGKSVEIEVYKDNPKEVKVPDIILNIPEFIGTVFGIIGIVLLFISGVIRTRRNNY